MTKRPAKRKARTFAGYPCSNCGDDRSRHNPECEAVEWDTRCGCRRYVYLRPYRPKKKAREVILSKVCKHNLPWLACSLCARPKKKASRG